MPPLSRGVDFIEYLLCDSSNVDVALTWNAHKQKAPRDAGRKALVLLGNFGCGRAQQTIIATGGKSSSEACCVIKANASDNGVVRVIFDVLTCARPKIRDAAYDCFFDILRYRNGYIYAFLLTASFPTTVHSGKSGYNSRVARRVIGDFGEM